MSRDKLLTIRIEEETREAFNNWCEARGYSYSRFLYEVVEGCLSGSIDESILSSKRVDSDIASKLAKRMESVEKLVSENALTLKVDDSVDEYIGNNLDKKVDEYLDSVHSSIDSKLDNKIGVAISEAATAVIANSLLKTQDELRQYVDNRINTAHANLRKEIEPILKAERENVLQAVSQFVDEGLNNLLDDEKFIEAVASKLPA